MPVLHKPVYRLILQAEPRRRVAVLEDGCIVEEMEGCHICLCVHDEDIHAATLSVHGWMRGEVTKWLYEDTEVPLDEEPVEYLVYEQNVA